MMPSKQLTIHATAVLLWSSLRKDELWQDSESKQPTLLSKRHRFEKGYIYPIKINSTCYQSEVLMCVWPKQMLIKLTNGSNAIGISIDVVDDVHFSHLRISADADETSSKVFVDEASVHLTGWLDSFAAKLQADAEKTAILGF